MALANNSLPVPLSPRISTVAEVVLILRMVSMHCLMTGLLPLILANGSNSGRSRATAFSRCWTLEVICNSS